jgi:beta-galactosidase/beta-glucuronidase
MTETLNGHAWKRRRKTLQILNGSWLLATDSRNAGKAEGWFARMSPEAQPAPVPGILQQVFPGYHGVAWYWHSFRLLAGLPPKERLLLHFGAVDYLAEVWLNGHYLGAREGGETPFEFDVTDTISRSGENLLAVRVLNPTHERIDGYLLQETPHRNKVIPARSGSSFNSGGIIYPVELRRVPAVFLADLVVRPDTISGDIEVQATIRNATSSPATGSLSIHLAPAAGGDVLDRRSTQADFPPGDSAHRLTLTVA